MKRVPWIAFLFSAVLLCCAHAQEKPLRVVTTFLPAYCFSANVAGDLAQVENLLPGTVSLHDYQLTPGDIRKLASADLIVVNGLGMETFLDRAIANAGPSTRAKIVRLSDGLKAELIDDTSQQHTAESGHDHLHNPHIWLDPRLAMHGVTNILRAFQSKDPARAKVYQDRATAYLAKLIALDADIEKGVAPIRNFSFITYHNAFPYFARRYGLKLSGVVEQVPEIPPSPRDLSQLLKNVRAQKVKALFTEPAGKTRLAQQIARDAGIKLSELDPLETGKLEPNFYEEGMRRNLAALVKTLSE